MDNGKIVENQIRFFEKKGFVNDLSEVMAADVLGRQSMACGSCIRNINLIIPDMDL